MGINEDKRAPTNTSREAHDEPILNLLKASVVGGRAIEQQEAQGQTELVHSDTLPSDMQCDTREVLESFGVEFLGQVQGDELFMYAKLPDGWSKKASGHSMWSYLVDEQGRERASIFYKAAFYDRKAHMSASRRFTITRDYDDTAVHMMHVIDCGKTVFSTDPVPDPTRNNPENRHEAWSNLDAIDKEARALCEQWLIDNGYPNWSDAREYWT